MVLQKNREVLIDLDRHGSSGDLRADHVFFRVDHATRYLSRMLAKISSKGFRRAGVWNPFYLWLVLLLVSFGNSSYARDKRVGGNSLVDRSKYVSSDAREIESLLWSGDERDIPLLESAIVRRIQLEPKSVLAHFLLAQLKMRLFMSEPEDLTHLKQASELAQQAIDLDPKNPVGYVAMAQILDLMGAADRGLELLDRAEVSLVAPNWRFEFTRARLSAGKASGQKVLQFLRKAIESAEADHRIIVPYVVAVLQSEYSGLDLIAELKDWRLRHPNPLFGLSIAITLSGVGRSKEAHSVYQALIQDDPTNREAQVNDAILLYRDLDQTKQAIRMLKVLIAGSSEQLDPHTKAVILTHLGAAHLKIKAWEAAQDAFVQALRANPRNIGTLDLVTQAYKDAKTPEKFVRFLREINSEAPGISVVHALLGETLSEQLSQHDAAVIAFSDAITLDPERNDYYTGLGLAYYRAGNFGQALKLFSAAMRIDPKDAVARYNEACVLTLLGRHEDALEALADALLLDPRLVATAQSDKDFLALQSIPRFHELIADESRTSRAEGLSH